MKLYFSPGACSLSPHIVAREANIPLEIERVQLQTKRTKSDADYRLINPKGSVPALVLDDGRVLTEGPAIIQFLADSKPEAKLAPPNGTFERAQLQEWLNYLSTEIHKSFSPLFNPKVPEDYKVMTREALATRFDYLSNHLEKSPFLMGDAFSVADAYLFTLLRWTKGVAIDLAKWPVLAAYVEKIGARPAAKAAIEAEALNK